MTEDAARVADFLKSNPEFLIKNPGILAFVRLPEGTTGNVTSLQDRQIQTLRDKIKSLEHRIAQMSGTAVENQAIVDSLFQVARSLLLVQDPLELTSTLIQSIKKHFHVPIVRLLLWSEAENAAQQKGVWDPHHSIYCGFAEKAPSLDVFAGEEINPRSTVLIPLRIGASPETFGVLGLGSPDKDRFAPGLETDFLNSLAEIACAALSKLNKVSV